LLSRTEFHNILSGYGRGAKPHWSVNEKDGVDAMEVKDLRIA